jgi:hypothetical protein
MPKKIRGVFVNAIIIRFEGPLAVCRKDDKSILDIKRFMLPNNAKEGDVLEITDSKISINTAETEKRHKRVEELLDDICS